MQLYYYYTTHHNENRASQWHICNEAHSSSPVSVRNLLDSKYFKAATALAVHCCDIAGRHISVLACEWQFTGKKTADLKMVIDAVLASGLAVIFLVVKWVLIIIVSLVVIGAIRSAIENRQSHFQETSRKINAEEAEDLWLKSNGNHIIKLGVVFG